MNLFELLLVRACLCICNQVPVHLPELKKDYNHAIAVTMLVIDVHGERRLKMIFHDPFRKVGDSTTVVSFLRKSVAILKKKFKCPKGLKQLRQSYCLDRADREDDALCIQHSLRWLLSFQNNYVVGKYFNDVLQPKWTVASDFIC